jgi:hypothetical protein
VNDFAPVFDALKRIFAQHEQRLAVKTDTPAEYTLVTKSASPFPQHKGQPMWFGSVKTGKAYVSFHLMPLYMCPPLNADISPALKKRMQGKTCFNFNAAPEPELADELKRLVEASLTRWSNQNWL